jgi:GT2 family glycosyltransferase
MNNPNSSDSTKSFDVSIIIVGWNVCHYVDKCLDSVFQETKGIRFEVIYVDNGSTDGTVDLVKSKYREALVIDNHYNLGFIKANNQAIRIARGRYVLLLNSDTIVLNNAIVKAIAFADENPKTAIVGCKVLNPDRSLQRSCFMQASLLNLILAATYLYKIFPKSHFFGREGMTWWNFDDPRQVDVVVGCFSLVRKVAIDEVGLMDEAFFVYGDDTDWCYRFRTAGWQVMFTPHPQIIHYGGQATKALANPFTLQLYGAKLQYFHKWHPRQLFAARLLISSYFFLRVPVMISLALFLRKDRKTYLLRADTYLKGAYYSLVDWPQLLMNAEEVRATLKPQRTD